jgi:hypothetical protein
VREPHRPHRGSQRPEPGRSGGWPRGRLPDFQGSATGRILTGTGSPVAVRPPGHRARTVPRLSVPPGRPLPTLAPGPHDGLSAPLTGSRGPLPARRRSISVLGGQSLQQSESLVDGGEVADTGQRSSSVAPFCGPQRPRPTRPR